MNESRVATQEKWRQVILAQQASGLTVAAYCRDRGIGEPSFYTWRRRLGQRLQSAEFVEIKTGPAAAEGIEVVLGGGRHLVVRPGFDRALLIALVDVLEGLA